MAVNPWEENLQSKKGLKLISNNARPANVFKAHQSDLLYLSRRRVFYL